MLSESQLEAAKAATYLTTGTSPFITGAQFTISGYEYDVVGDDPKAKPFPVFVTSLGNLSIASLIRPKSVDPFPGKDGELIFAVTPSGTLSDLIRKLGNEHRGETHDEFLPKLVEACKDKRFVVRKREYYNRTSDYGPRPVPIAHIDIVVD